MGAQDRSDKFAHVDTGRYCSAKRPSIHLICGDSPRLPRDHLCFNSRRVRGSTHEGSSLHGQGSVGQAVQVDAGVERVVSQQVAHCGAGGIEHRLVANLVLGAR